MENADQTVSWRRHAQALQILAAAVLMAYSNSFATGFSADSSAMILQDPRVHHITRQNLHDILLHNYAWPAFWSGLYRPLSTLSYLFNFVILGSGGSPTGYHWVNLVLHASNAFLVYLLMLLLVRQYWPAVLTGTLWALHPIATEGVTYIAGRPEELAALGALAALICYIHGTQDSGARRSRWLVAAMAATTVAVFSKEGGVMVLPLAMLYDFTFRTPGSLRNRATGYAFLAVPILVMLGLRWLVLRQESAMQIPFADNPILGESFFTGRLMALGVIGRYLKLLLWPLTLSCDYSYNQLPHFDPLASAAVAGLLVVAAICYLRTRIGFFMMAFAALTLLPGSNLLFVTGTIMAERLLYLPSVGFAAAVVVSVHWLARRAGMKPAAAALALSFVGVAYGARTYLRNPDWTDNETLYGRAEETDPLSFKPHMMLAVALLEQNATNGNLDRAIAEAEQAEAIVAGLPDSRKPEAIPWVRGTLYFTRGESLSARDAAGNPQPDPVSLVWYRKALDADLEAVRIDRALNEEYRSRELARGRQPSEINLIGPHELYSGLGRLDLRLGDRDQALQSFLYERRLAPGAAAVYVNLSSLDIALDRPGDAAAAMLESYVLDGSDETLRKLLRLYAAAEPAGCATAQGVEGPTLNRECPTVQHDFCRAYRDLEQGSREAHLSDQVERFRNSAQRVPGCQ